MIKGMYHESSHDGLRMFASIAVVALVSATCVIGCELRVESKPSKSKAQGSEVLTSTAHYVDPKSPSPEAIQQAEEAARQEQAAKELREYHTLKAGTDCFEPQNLTPMDPAYRQRSHICKYSASREDSSAQLCFIAGSGYGFGWMTMISCEVYEKMRRIHQAK